VTKPDSEFSQVNLLACPLEAGSATERIEAIFIAVGCNGNS
jgi:hypothetical protein